MHASPPAQNLLAAIDQLLPQTQCTQCNYPGCLAYARAIAGGEAEINQCPPGGEVSIQRLAQLLARPAVPLNPENGAQQPLQCAFIHEPDCIGCKLCIAACPVDCIIGATKLMHTVIANDCSGCELCVPVCPTDCITMRAPARHASDDNSDPPNPSMWSQFSQQQVEKSRARAQQKRRRVNAQQRARARHTSHRRRACLQQEIRAAVQRKQAQQQQA